MSLLLCLLSSALLTLAAPSVFYSKHFPGSVPAFVSVEIQKDGNAVYKEAPEEENPVEFHLPAADADEMFALVEKLDRFKQPLESNLKVANMGMKTFRFQDGAEKQEVKFNYSVDPNAKLLLDWFERLTETQQLLFALERTVRFDHLGVNQSLLQLEAAYDRKRLVGPDRFLPMLDRVTKSEKYLNIARERAGTIAAAIRNPKPPAAE